MADMGDRGVVSLMGEISQLREANAILRTSLADCDREARVAITEIEAEARSAALIGILIGSVAGMVVGMVAVAGGSFLWGLVFA
ncbi:MAG: hypothetical protein ACEQSU_13975 [Microgenomates group bacterium]